METIDIALQKLPPQNIEAEQSVLGAVLLDNSSLNKAIEILDVSAFYKETHRRIYTAMLDLFEKGDAIDLITLTDHLQKKGELELIGGSSYLAALANIVPTAANIRYHSKLVHEKAMLRNLINTATEIATSGYENTQDIEELLDSAEKSIFAISEKRIKQSFVDVKEIVKSSFETIEKLYEKKEMVTGLATGFIDFDEMTSGLQPGDLIIVAGRPGMGKTALSLCIAQNAAIERKSPVAIFSLEMTKEQLVLRMLCSEARVDAHKLRSGYLGKTDWPKLTTAAGRLSEAPIFIDDSSALSVIEMRAKARRLMAKQGLGLIIVDYLQLMRGRGRSDTREQEISEISRSLKALAKELNTPIIAISQLNRAVESRTDRKPMLADLRESGAIEQDADLIVFVYREEAYKPCSCEHDAQCTCGRRGVAEAVIGKQRNGPVGTVKLAYINKYTRFENLEKR